MTIADPSTMIMIMLPPRDTPSWEAGKWLDAFWGEVRTRLDRDDDKALGEVHVGAPGEGGIPWAHTNDGEDRVNLTLELKPEQLELNLVGWKEAQSNSLKEWLQSVPGEDAVNPLDDYQVIAFARRAYKKTPTSRPWWQDETMHELGRCSATKFSAGWLMRTTTNTKSKKEEKPAFHLRRVWPRNEAEALGDTLPSEIAGEVRRLLPILREIWSR